MKKIRLFFCCTFFSVMFVLTWSSRSIHNRNLPKVTAQRLPEKYFQIEYIDDDGVLRTGEEQRMAISESFMEGRTVYLVYTAVKNGEEREFVRVADVETGRETDGYFEVLAGIGYLDRVVTGYIGELTDGCEVLVVDGL